MNNHEALVGKLRRKIAALQPRRGSLPPSSRGKVRELEKQIDRLLATGGRREDSRTYP